MAGKSAKKHKRGAGPISIILLLTAMICIAYGIIVLQYFRSQNWFNYIWFIVGALLLIFSFLFSGSAGLPSVVKWILGIIILAVLVNFGIYVYRVADYAFREPPENADWLIVLGAKVNGDQPSTEFSARIEKAAEYAAPRVGVEIINKSSFDHGLRIITTGGRGEDEGAAEGFVSARELNAHGIPWIRLLIEDKSTTTVENLEFAKEIILANGGSMQDKVLIVSSGFHLYRVSKLAAAAGYYNAEYLGATGLKVLVPHYVVREYAANIKERLLGSYGD